MFLEPLASLLAVFALLVVASRRTKWRALPWVALSILVLGISYLVLEAGFVLFLDRSHAVTETALCRRWIRRHAGAPNSRGFRDRENTHPVVAILGSSFVWGQGVEREERISERLGAKLEVSVANWSRPGADLRTKLEILKRLPRPPILVYVYGWSDIHKDGAPEGPPLRRLPWFEDSYSLSFFWYSFCQPSRPSSARLYADGARLREHEADLATLKALAPEGRLLVVGWPWCRSGPEWGFAYDWVSDCMERLRVTYLDLREAFYGVPELRCWPYDPHPSALAHELASEALKTRLKRLEWVR